MLRYRLPARRLGARMSYLDGPRIAFTGRFFGDVSTVNNDDASFQPSPQPPNPPPGLNWNPGGSATFDFLNCRVVGGEGASGAPMSVDDPARGLAIVGAADRSSAKLVDLDPDWQRSSQLWGLAVRLVDPATGEELLSGSFRVAAFRDLWARQFQRWRPNGPVSGGAFVTLNGQPSGGSYTSVLDDVVYGPGVASSPVLSALQRAATTPRLSIVLNLFGYFTRHVDGRFATGSLTGCIGPWRPGEPDTFVAGRRIEMGVVRQASPASASAPPTRPVFFGASVAALDQVGSRLVLDLGNAYPIVNPAGVPFSLAELSSAAETVTALQVGLLGSEAIPANHELAPGRATVLGTIDLPQAPSTAGVFSLPLDPVVVAQAAGRPLALLARRPDDSHRVLCRETVDGLYVRADEFVHRIDAKATGAATLATGAATFYAVKRGEPAPHETIHLGAVQPPGALKFSTPVETGADGTVQLPLTAADPGNPRGAIDGLVATIRYSPRLANGQPDYRGTGLIEELDVVVVHVREVYDPPQAPDWEADIKPILAQYARLYPIMSKHLVDLADLDAVRQLRTPMLLAMTRDIADSNYMPVTRDLSEAKRTAIVRWLEQLPPVTEGAQPATAGVGVEPSPDAAAVAATALEDPSEFDAKSTAAAAVGRRVIARQADRTIDDEER
jgi:hypothetical protein